MTEQTGRPPEERLPAPVPASAPAPAERFSAPPSAHRNDLTPERAARIVRQSANARFVGFLAVTVVALFVIVYYFIELGMPALGVTPRLDLELEEQQVTAVERGYDLYQANCAQCHGVNGEGGKGPILNDQVKLFAHLNPDYLRNILVVGGRYACGNPDTIMPVWANTGNPPGPLNYYQINNLIAFLRAEKGHEYRVMDPELWEPVLDEAGNEVTFEGWVDPAYKPEPGATPYPDCWTDSFATPAPSAGPATPAPSGEVPSASVPPVAQVLKEAAVNIAFVNGELAAPADVAFQIEFDNQDTGMVHNMEIKDGSGATVFLGEYVTGPIVTTYNVDNLPAGDYTYICTIHPQMTGTLKVGG
jgi:mono/diheme cytochrome c family protein